MVVIVCAILWLTSSFLIFLVSFWTGRCARKLPIIDDHLPWTISRDQGPHCPAQDSPPPEPPQWPYSNSP
jgi:hypothetical protein